MLFSCEYEIDDLQTESDWVTNMKCIMQCRMSVIGFLLWDPDGPAEIFKSVPTCANATSPWIALSELARL